MRRLLPASARNVAPSLRGNPVVALILGLAFLPLAPGGRAFGQTYAAPRLDKWRILGPGGGGAQFYPAVSPHDPSLVLVACDMTGAYISQDGGNSWRMFNLRAPVRFFVFDPIDPRVIYAAADALFRSTDTGKTWALIFPSPDSATRLIMPDDHASPVYLTAARPFGSVTALAVDPADSRALYVAASFRNFDMLYTSTDSGQTWRQSALLGERTRKIYVDPNSPPSDRAVYVVAKNYAAFRQAGRWTRYPPPAGVEEFRDVSGGFAAGGRLTLYTVADVKHSGETLSGGLLVSRDGEAMWTEANDALLRSAGLGPASAASSLPELTSVAASFSRPDVAYVSYEDWRVSPRALIHGVGRTADGGRTWKLVWKESESPAANVHDAWINERFGTGWGEPGISLGVSPTNPDICYRTDDGRTMRTTDGGLNWETVYSRMRPDHTWTSTGLDVTTNYGVFFDPFDPKRMFIAYTDIGLFASDNGGQSWMSATRGVPAGWVNTTYWIVFDPEVKGRVWGAMSYTHDLPRPKMWRRSSPAKFAGGVCMSDDGGRTWRASNQGMPSTAATHILLDPTSPRQARVLYATGFGKGVFKSVDGGKTWALKNQGLAGPEPFAWRLARDRNGVLYLVVARRSEDGSFGNAGDGALYRSRDGAEHWERIALPEGLNGPNGVTADPEDSNRLYLAAWGHQAPKGAVDGGIFVSTDGGKSWRNVLARDQHVYDVTVDRRGPRPLYACGFESSAWRSTDRGETWQRIKGFNFKWGHRVIPDPRNSEMIYIATYGGSVWYGPAAGDPKAVEDIVTPALAYGK